MMPPMTRVFLRAEWRSLVMLNYAISPDVLLPWLPDGLELDLWRGEAMVSVVGFLFKNCRVFGVGSPGLGNFEEVNLRFYVRRRAGVEWRRGVVFIKEIVPSPIVAAMARIFFQERYVAMPMSHRVEGNEVEFGWSRGGRWESVTATTRENPEPISPGSEEEFILEHYWGYVRRRDGSTVEYAVEHPPWLVHQTSKTALNCAVGELYGPEFADALSRPPRSAFVAEGSKILVRFGQTLIGP